jgi:hypothetical protein
MFGPPVELPDKNDDSTGNDVLIDWLID